MKKLFVKSYGCQMNVYDAERMVDLMKPHGYQLVDAPKGADMVVLNTCHIREKASEKVFSDLGRLKLLQKEKGEGGERMVIAVAGCVAQAEGEEILRRAPYVDVVVGPQTYYMLPEMVTKALRNTGEKERLIAVDFHAEQKFDFLPETFSLQGPAAFLSIQEGCDKFCTYCVVPYTRGAEYSRSIEAILKEARTLVKAGAREITVLGQNVNAFHGRGPDGKEWGLGRLIMALAEIEGIDRLRYTTSHPQDMDDELVQAHAEVPKLMPFLHLPVQSGSDKVLARMNRKHTGASYRQWIEKLRKACPEIAFSSDFIVGFPGESEADFKETLKLVQDVFFAQAYSFKYSPRPGTPASVMEDQIKDEVKSERLQELQRLLDAQQLHFNQEMVGKTIPVLFERLGKNTDQYAGRSEYLQTVKVEAPRSLLGQILNVKIMESHPKSLIGVLETVDDRALQS